MSTSKLAAFDKSGYYSEYGCSLDRKTSDLDHLMKVPLGDKEVLKAKTLPPPICPIESMPIITPNPSSVDEADDHQGAVRRLIREASGSESRRARFKSE